MAGAGKEERRDDIVELARRRGFIWQAFEIYGGAAGFYDYGPLGARLKRRLETKWREFYLREGFYEIETTTIAPREVFASSGHLASFTDPAVVCKRCSSVFRVDASVHRGVRCPECGGELEPSGEFLLMFQTRIGVTKSDQDPQAQRKGEGYLRPETAQGMFVNFQRLLKFNRDKLPFGIMQIGKAYRNEISPRQSLIRLREFTMAEVEIFVAPAEKERHPRFAEVADRSLKLVPQGGEVAEMTVDDAVRRGIIANQYLGYHLARVDQFLEEIGIPRTHVHFRQHLRDEMAHYATDCWDAEFLSEKYSWMEIVGVADRGNYDLSAHAASLHLDLQVQTESGKVVPHVIEPSFGLDRIIYALLESALYEEEVERETRRVLRFTPAIAPVQVAVFPLLNREDLQRKAHEVFEQLRAASFFVEYDTSGSIGKRYRRQDEIGTPYCITIDYQTLEDETVTVRERDTMKQVRVPLSGLQEALK